ncbi:MAG: DegV family protein, partial [Ruminococcus sp.]|nr:DegV family protein [Ruminococcus sp.]
MVKIIADSTCDLSQELIKKYDITLLPLHVLLGEKDCKDGKEVNAEDIYKWADENKTTPKTAAPSPQEVIDLFESFAKDDTEIICFSISGEMSGTYSVMKLAKEEVKNEEKIYVIDSRNLSTGIGLLVLEAATMAREGKTAKEIVEYLDTIKGKVRSSFVVDTLTYLHRGGRCSGVTAMAGNMMKLHPKIIVTDGKMEVGKKYRGSISKSLLKYVRDMEDELKNA